MRAMVGIESTTYPLGTKGPLDLSIGSPAVQAVGGYAAEIPPALNDSNKKKRPGFAPGRRCLNMTCHVRAGIEPTTW